jgi:choline dehydrogenase-like flavoprotein
MIHDFNHIEEGNILHTDLCVIGAGALGIAIALEFLNTNTQVLILESGGLKPENETRALYDSEIVGIAHNGAHSGRTRIFGGTSTLWGGQALRLAPIDFMRRPWVENSGWDISQPEIEPYYIRAEAILSLDLLSYEKAPWQVFNITPPAYDQNKFLPYFSKWSPQPNFALVYGDAIRRSSNITCLLHANVVEIVSDRDESTVEYVEIKSLIGRSARVQAKDYIVCAGGIETARLLLSSNRINSKGIGNQHDLVGRFFQDHVSVQCGEILPNKRSEFQNIYDQFYINKVKYFHKITATETFQTQQEILNIAAHIYFEFPQDHGIVLAKKIFRDIKNRTVDPLWLKELGYVLKDSDDVIRVLHRYFWAKRSFSPKRGVVKLEAHVEQAPNWHSRINLSTEVDALGMSKAQVDWQITEQTRKTVTVFVQAIAAEFSRLELGYLQLAPFLQPAASSEAVESWKNKCSDLNHHMGTTRMSNSLKDGVVDRDCKVHNINNLHIAGSAVFPTSGYSNPTLTALALGLRLCDRLKSRL